MATSARARTSDESAGGTRVKEQHLDVLRLTKHLAAKDENFCEVMKELGKPIAIGEIKLRPVPVMACMRVAAMKVCGLGASSFFTIVTLQLQFSGLVQDWEVLEKLGIKWRPNFYAGADPSKLTDSIEENATRERTLALVDELIDRIERDLPT